MIDNHVYERAMYKLERLSVVYNNIIAVPTDYPRTEDGEKLILQLETEMSTLFTYLQQNAKGQV